MKTTTIRMCDAEGCDDWGSKQAYVFNPETKKEVTKAFCPTCHDKWRKATLKEVMRGHSTYDQLQMAVWKVTCEMVKR